MYAGHLAAGLALKGRARNVPVAALLAGAFVLDGFWILFGVLRIDRTLWDDWSHSLAMAMLWSTLFAILFWRLGRLAMLILWLAVFSHYLLDYTVQGASLYPLSARSEILLAPITTHAHLFQLLVTVPLLLVFVLDQRRAGAVSWKTWSVCILVIALNVRFLIGL